MIPKLTFYSLHLKNFNYFFEIILDLKQKLHNTIFKVILNYVNKIYTFNLFNKLKLFINNSYFYREINNYMQNLIFINISSYFNIFFKSNNDLRKSFKNSKKNEKKIIFVNYLNFIPLYLKGLLSYPKLDNTYLLEKYFKFITKINKTNNILIETRVRNNIYLLLDYSISFNSYFDFFSIEMYNMIILSKYLSNKSNLKNTSIHHTLLSLINNNTLFNNHINLLNDEELNINNINKLIKNEKAKVKAKNLLYFSFFNLIIKLYFDTKIFLTGNKNLIKKTLLSKEIKVLFQYMIKLNKYIFKTLYLTPDYILFTLFNFKNLKVSKIFLSLLINNFKKNILKLNSFIYNKNIKYNNQNFLDKNQQYYFFLLRRSISEYQLKMLLNSVHLKHIINYFRFLILDNTLNKVTKKNLYKNFVEDILIINNYRY